MYFNKMCPPRPCGLARRLAAIFYDSLLLLAVWFTATLPLVLYNVGQAIAYNNIPYHLYLLALAYLYFTWQWTHGGRTLGMQAWNIRLVQPGKKHVTWSNANLRFGLALCSWLILGGGYLMAWFDPEGLALHDRYSGTRLYTLGPSAGT